MASFIFNQGKGKIAEYAARVVANDPTNSAIVIVLLKAVDTEANMKDYDDLAALLGDAQVTEADFTNYARQVVTNPTVTVDDTNDRVDVDIPDQTISSAGGTTDNTVLGAVYCYDSDTTGGTDANIIPLVFIEYNSGSGTATNGNDATIALDTAYLSRHS